MMIIPLTCMTLNLWRTPTGDVSCSEDAPDGLESIARSNDISSWYRCCLHNVMELQAVLLHSLQMISFVSDFVRKADRVCLVSIYTWCLTLAPQSFITLMRFQLFSPSLPHRQQVSRRSWIWLKRLVVDLIDAWLIHVVNSMFAFSLSPRSHNQIIAAIPKRIKVIFNQSRLSIVCR